MIKNVERGFIYNTWHYGLKEDAPFLCASIIFMGLGILNIIYGEAIGLMSIAVSISFFLIIYLEMIISELGGISKAIESALDRQFGEESEYE